MNGCAALDTGSALPEKVDQEKKALKAAPGRAPLLNTNRHGRKERFMFMRIRIIGVLRNCIFGMAGIAAVAAVAASIGLFWFLAGKAEKDAADMMERCREYMRAEVAEKNVREERYQDPGFFEERGNAALSDRMDQPVPEFDPEEPFDALPEELKGMLLRDGWRVILYDVKIDAKGAGQVVGQMDPEKKTIALTVEDPERTVLVLYHEVGHIVAEEIRMDLIRAGYTSRETLPDIVFHGGADTAYHEDLYEEYLANYLGESIFYRENAELAGNDFLRIYEQAIKNLPE